MKITDVQNLIIGGVHKAGTTSLYTYLSWHPDVCASDIKETHFFSDHRYPKRYDSYSAFFKKHKNHNYLLEASPEYIYGKEMVADKILKQFPDSKLIFLLRNPAEKMLSSFNHRKKKLIFDANYTFKEFERQHLTVDSLVAINEENEYMRELLDGSYIDYLPVWFEKFEHENIKILFFDDLRENPGAVVEKVCTWLGIDRNFYENKTFEPENKSVSIRNGAVQNLVVGIANKMEPVLRRNYQLKKFLRNLYYSINVDSKRKSEPINLESIEDLYKIKNKALKEFLLEKGYRDFPTWL
ncbi:MAG TPA: sulfotransferase [Flavobacteriaceae bacterium]|nr:sulfotransferase [Flavobacteriaceae bacterium]